METDKKDEITAPRMLTLGEFKVFAEYLSKVTDKTLEVEHKSYEGFVENVDPEHQSEFFKHGYVTIGEWRLWFDLEISKATKKKKDKREILDCTDDGGYGLPYFDRFYQKYLYLKNNPDHIIKIGMRNEKEIDSVRYRRGAPRRDIGSRSDVLRRVEDKVIKFDKLINMEKIRINHRSQAIRIKNPPAFTFKILKKSLNRYRVWELKSGDIKIKKIDRGHDAYLYNDNRSPLDYPCGGALLLKRIYIFNHFLIDFVLSLCIKYDFDLEQRHIDFLHVNGASMFTDIIKLRRSFTRKKNLLDPHMKEILRLPIFLIGAFEFEFRNINVLDIIKYYNDHREYLSDFMEVEKDANKGE